MRHNRCISVTFRSVSSRRSKQSRSSFPRCSLEVVTRRCRLWLWRSLSLSPRSPSDFVRCSWRFLSVGEVISGLFLGPPDPPSLTPFEAIGAASPLGWIPCLQPRSNSTALTCSFVVEEPTVWNTTSNAVEQHLYQMICLSHLTNIHRDLERWTDTKTFAAAPSSP